jgi:trehalose 6-phosphate phosphatase
VRPLSAHWNEVAARLAAARTIALFLDFDGTLAGFKTRPEDVHLNASVRRSLARLAHSPRFQVCVISGRRRADVAARIGVPRVHYLGLHGWDDGEDARLGAPARSALVTVKQKIGQLLSANKGIWLEDKAASLAVHDRTSDPSLPRALEAIVKPHSAHLRLASARRVWEIIPHEIENKGSAVRRRMSSLASPALPVYLGDDWIDEPAFHALARGITVHVGRRRNTRARYWLSGVAAVHAFLNRLANDFS